MKTFTTYFSSKEKLTQFLTKNKIIDSPSLMIQVFTPYADKPYIQELLSTINSLLPRASLIGSTTDGEINHGVLSKDETVLNFTLFLNTELTPYISNNFENFFQAGEHLADNVIKPDTKAVISFIDGTHNNDKEFLDGIETLNSDVKVVTALSGVKDTFATTFVFNKSSIYTDAVVSIALHSTKLEVNIQPNHFKKIGESLTITKVDSNRVYTINDKTAYDAYLYYLGKKIAKQLPAIGIQFPLIIQRGKVNITRVVIGKEKDGSLIFTENFEEGDTVHFAYPDKDSSKKASSNTDQVIDSILMHNPSKEKVKLSHKDIQLPDFFTYRAFYYSHKSIEKNTRLLVLKENEKTNTVSNNENIIQALSHFLHFTEKELENTKSNLEKQILKNPPPIEHKSARSQMHSLSGTRVLLTEDNKTNQKIIQGILKESGIVLDIANNGQEAVDAVKSKEYALILMDVQMPLMGGLEASQHIRAFNKNIPIIALTASNRPRDIQDTQLAGMNEHLIKPINVEKLFTTLLKYITNKVNFKHAEINEDSTILPNFKSIDTKLGLKHLGEDRSLYIKILQDFEQRYKNINLEFLSHDEYDRVLHTIQGLSANIGATALHKSTSRLHFHVQDSLTSRFYIELSNVLKEIQTLTKIEYKQKVVQQTNISKQEKESIFRNLKNAIEKERPKLCAPLIQQLSDSKLNAKDTSLLNIIKTHVNEFDFDEALVIIDKAY